MNESITIVLPLPARVLQPNCTVGSIGGRFMKASATKRYRLVTCVEVELNRIETAPWSKVSVKVTFFHTAKRRRDEDNAIGSLKAVYDGIVDAGLVADDDWEHMSREAPRFRIDKKHPRVELTITRMDQ